MQEGSVVPNEGISLYPFVGIDSGFITQDVSHQLIE